MIQTSSSKKGINYIVMLPLAFAGCSTGSIINLLLINRFVEFIAPTSSPSFSIEELEALWTLMSCLFIPFMLLGAWFGWLLGGV